jgi:hypothetical protein
MTVSTVFHLERPGRRGDNRQPARVPCDGLAKRHELTPLRVRAAIDDHGSRGQRKHAGRAV